MRNNAPTGGYIGTMGMVLVSSGLPVRRSIAIRRRRCKSGSTMRRAVPLVLQSADSRPERNYTAQALIIEVMRDINRHDALSRKRIR